MATSSRTAERAVRVEPFAAPHVFALAVIDGPDVEAVHRIVRGETIIGRDFRADVALRDDEVSKQHCTVRCDAGICHIVDAGSLNGTTVNDRPLRRGVAHRLRHLDEIQIGTTRFLFLVGRFKDYQKSARGA